MRFLLIIRISTEDTPAPADRKRYTARPQTAVKTPGSTTNMRISNIEWLKKRIGFIRKLGEQTARQRQIIDLLDNEDRTHRTGTQTSPRAGNSGKTTYRHRRTSENRRSRNESREKTTTGTQSPTLSRGWATDRSRTGRHKNRRAIL